MAVTEKQRLECAFKAARKFVDDRGYSWAISDRLCREFAAALVEALDDLEEE